MRTFKMCDILGGGGLLLREPVEGRGGEVDKDTHFLICQHLSFIYDLSRNTRQTLRKGNSLLGKMF